MFKLKDKLKDVVIECGFSDVKLKDIGASSLVLTARDLTKP